MCSSVLIVAISEPIFPPTNNLRFLDSVGSIYIAFSFAFLVFLASSKQAFRENGLTRALAMLGDISFPFYLMQFLTFEWFWIVVNQKYSWIFYKYEGWLFVILQAIVVTPLLFWVSYFWAIKYERFFYYRRLTSN